MRRNGRRGSTISPPIQKIKASQHLLRLEEDENDEFNGKWSNHFRLPSLPRQKSWKDDNVLSHDNSVATSVSWSQEMESVATQKLEEQWATVERTFYGEDNQLYQESILDECIQWRTQIPYLRIIGKNPTCDNGNMQPDDGLSNKQTKRRNSQNDKVFAEYNLLMKEEEDSVQYKLNKAKFEDVLDMMTEYVISELFPNEKSDSDSLRYNLSDTLKIAPAPVHGNRKFSRNSKANWTEEAISPNYIENKSISIRNRLLDMESSFQTIKNDANHQEAHKLKNSGSANKSRNFEDTEDDALRSKERMCTPHIGRNKLGTIFNERIVVSPVPFTVSTRESFSTVKTIPIKFMNENLEFSSYHGSARNIGFQSSVRRSSTFRNPSIHSAWQTPVSPTVWPKNIRLAPIDTSRLPSNKNRSFVPAILHCNNKKPLSPISRSTIPKSAHATCDCSSNFLAIQGKNIPTQSKINLLSADWNYNSRITKGKKKKARIKEKL